MHIPNSGFFRKIITNLNETFIMKIAHKELLNNKHKETAEPVQILYSQITIIIFIIPKLLTSLKEMLDLPNFGHMKFSW